MSDDNPYQAPKASSKPDIQGAIQALADALRNQEQLYRNRLQPKSINDFINVAYYEGTIRHAQKARAAVESLLSRPITSATPRALGKALANPELAPEGHWIPNIVQERLEALMHQHPVLEETMDAYVQERNRQRHPKGCGPMGWIKGEDTSQRSR